MTALPPFLLEGFYFILAHESRELAAAGIPPQPSQSFRTTEGPLPPRSRCHRLRAALAKWLKSRHPPQSRIFIKNLVSVLPSFSPSRIHLHEVHPLKKGKAQLFPLCCPNDLKGLDF